ncbi:MAG: type 2 isopentenyl-diphosphate Delta-isomerase [Candidatus Bathyarchaeota archaeon]|nr:type 2 isopentenyl-diphosphate Delta-isomerase [Candidatus Bathyarchaeota archaeon]
MAEETEKRKADHIRICLSENAQAREATTGFEDVHLVHKALPEIDKHTIDLSTDVFGHKFAAPIIVGAMTGGTAEATRINSAIAEAVETLRLGMGVGSQRAAIENKKLEQTFAVARKKAPTAFLIANLGGIQLVHGYGVKEVTKAIEIIDADAVAIHLNSLQEAVQPEGQVAFKGVLEKIAEIAKAVDKPVIVKETGSGIAAAEARALEAAGVKGIDVSGAGGTSFAAVEYYRAKGQGNTAQRLLGDAFWDWGIPTVASLVETAQTVKIPVVASGGVRNGVDVSKALALGASLASLSQPVLQAAVKGVEATEEVLSFLMEELRNVMFLVGAEKAAELAKAPVVITGKTAEWLKTRGFNIESYARRGAR